MSRDAETVITTVAVCAGIWIEIKIFAAAWAERQTRKNQERRSMERRRAARWMQEFKSRDRSKDPLDYQ